jgi:hypothetical protein
VLKDLKNLIDSGQVHIASSLSWSEHVPATVQNNLPTLGYLTHPSQLAFLTRCSMLQEASNREQHIYHDGVLTQVLRAKSRCMKDDALLLKWGKEAAVFDDQCRINGDEDEDPKEGRRKFVLAYLVRRNILSTDMETSYFATVVCQAFSFTTPAFYKSFKNDLRTKLFRAPEPESEMRARLNVQECWDRILAVDNRHASLWANERLLNATTLVFRILLQETGSVSWLDVKRNLGESSVLCPLIRVCVLCAVCCVMCDVCCVLCAV